MSRAFSLIHVVDSFEGKRPEGQNYNECSCCIIQRSRLTCSAFDCQLGDRGLEMKENFADAKVFLLLAAGKFNPFHRDNESEEL